MHLLALVGLALLKGSVVPSDFTVHDHHDKAAKFSTLRSGHPTIVFYEDKDGGGQNDHFKERLGKLAVKKVTVLAIADVGSWNFWPAKGFVKDALENAGKKAGITVWADWSGAGRTALAASSNKSNVVVLDASGKVMWASAGKLVASQEDDLLKLVGKLGA